MRLYLGMELFPGLTSEANVMYIVSASMKNAQAVVGVDRFRGSMAPLEAQSFDGVRAREWPIRSVTNWTPSAPNRRLPTCASKEHGSQLRSSERVGNGVSLLGACSHVHAALSADWLEVALAGGRCCAWARVGCA